MKSLDIYESIEYLELFNKIDCLINNITIDTRKVQENDCYIGIKGENNDGNKLYTEAFNKGAKLVILDHFEINDEINKYLIENNKSIILVKNTIKTLGCIAKIKRNSFKNPVIAVTGSAGKTSTKDMIYSVLNEKFNAYKTVGNQNNHIGLPLTVFGLKDEYQILVLEMGMNHQGEISYLTDIAKPDVAVITNVGTAHIGNLGSRENILNAKLEILEGLDKNGILIINNDNDLLHDWYLKNKDKYNIITVGIYEASNYNATDIKKNENSTTFKVDNELIEVPVGGEHFIYNSLVSYAVGKIYNVSVDKIKKGIKNFELSSNRMSIINLKDNIKVINDSYNANYDSMNYAIKYLSSLNGRNIAVLGTMKELGNYSKKLHEDIGKVISSENIDILITVGDDSIYINNSAIDNGFNKEFSYHFDNNKDAINLINSLKNKDDNILVKASNSLNFKEIVEEITKNS